MFYFRIERMFFKAKWRHIACWVLLGLCLNIASCQAKTPDAPKKQAAEQTANSPEPPPAEEVAAVEIGDENTQQKPLEYVEFDAADTPELAEQAARTGVPDSVTQALRQARVPLSQVALVVAPADGGEPLVNFNSDRPMNPASTMKLVTTAAALDILGAHYIWRTKVWADGVLDNGVLNGDLYVQGSGDPKLVVEKLWLLLQQIKRAGIHSIKGDLVVDDTAFDLPVHQAGAFDGEPLRPYNAVADALLINYKSIELSFTPDTEHGVAYIGITPPLAGVEVQETIPLAQTACGAWKKKIKAQFGNSKAVNFAGRYPASCGSRSLYVAYRVPEEFAARAIAGLWLDLGGSIQGKVRFAKTPSDIASKMALTQITSPTLSEVIRDINKYSNNVMARQVFLTLGLHAYGVGTYANANGALHKWWLSRLGDTPMPVIENGSGLSRTSRIRASSMAAMLQAMWKSPNMPEFMASMPVAGIDGTLRRSRVRVPGSAHLKTGTLRDSSALAGYVLANNGKYYVFVAMANSTNAANARRAFELLVDWTMYADNNLTVTTNEQEP